MSCNVALIPKQDKQNLVVSGLVGEAILLLWALKMDLMRFIAVLSVAGIGLQVVLGGVLLAKKAWKRYPLFTTYSLFSLFASVAVYFSVYFFPGNRKISFYSFWIGEAITIVLGFGVIYEVFRHLFSNNKALLKQARLIFRWTAIAWICVAFSVVWVQAPDASMLRNGVLVFDEATRVVELGLLMFLFAASLALGLPWRKAEFGIALGLGLFVAVELATMALRAQIGLRTSLWQVLDVVRVLAFNTSLLVWLGYLLAPESAGEGARFGMS